MSENEPNKNFWELAGTMVRTFLQEETETLPSTRSDSGISEATTHLPGHRDVEMAETESNTPTPSLRLEIKGDKGQKSVTIPVNLKNLYSGMVLLEVNSFGFIEDPETLQGKQAILRVMSAEATSINGIMTWTYNATDQIIKINLRMQDTPPNKLASKILESWLPATSTSKELKGFWSLWDKTQANREAI